MPPLQAIMCIACWGIKKTVTENSDSTLTRDFDIAILSVRLSVRPSACDVPVFYGNGLKYCHNFFTTR